MFSTYITIRNSDSHSIIDLYSNRKVNEARDVKIGNHVWLGGVNSGFRKRKDGMNVLENRVGGGKYIGWRKNYFRYAVVLQETESAGHWLSWQSI